MTGGGWTPDGAHWPVAMYYPKAADPGQQLTSGQFSPRVLRAFLRDRAIQFALGVFISTFAYAMVVQRAVTGSAGHHPFVPRIAVTGAFVLVLASVGLFIFYSAAARPEDLPVLRQWAERIDSPAGRQVG